MPLLCDSQNILDAAFQLLVVFAGAGLTGLVAVWCWIAPTNKLRIASALLGLAVGLETWSWASSVPDLTGQGRVLVGTVFVLCGAALLTAFFSRSTAERASETGKAPYDFARRSGASPRDGT